MIGLDTNVIVRLLTADDDRQSRLALDFLAQCSAENPGYVSIIVLVEVAWVLRDGYSYSRDAVGQALQWLFESSNLRVERQMSAKAAVDHARSRNADYADALIARLSLDDGVTHVVTFDREAARRVPGMELLK